MTSPLSPEAVAQMVADVKQEITVECVNSEMDRLVAGRIMKALTTLSAENATLRAENEELDFLRHEGGPDSVAAMEIELATLRASESAAWARVKVLEAALLKTRALVCEAAVVGFNYADGDWADRLYRNNGDMTAALTPTADKE